MSIGANSCPNCGKRGGLTAVKEFGKEKVPGSFCKKCTNFIADKQSRQFKVACDGCKKSMGHGAAQVDVFVDGKRVHKGVDVKKFMCPDCSHKRGETSSHDPDEVLTRYTTECMGGCGNVQGWIDVPEGNTPPDLNVGYCNACTPKAAEEAADKAATETKLDALVKETANPNG